MTINYNAQIKKMNTIRQSNTTMKHPVYMKLVMEEVSIDIYSLYMVDSKIAMLNYLRVFLINSTPIASISEVTTMYPYDIN